jgi:hypothetical protein
MSDVFVAETSGKSFVLYNDQELSDEPVTDEDIFPCKAHGEEMKSARSEAWSSGCYWFFVILATGIALINVETNEGMFCRKKSWKFIEEYLNARVRFGKYI